MKKLSGILLKIISNFLGLLFALFIIVCLICLFKFLYFPSKEKFVPEPKPVDKFSKDIAQPRETGHFHILDQKVYSDAKNAPICLRCHGNFCHHKSEELRSFYNMHTFYLACESCHIRPEGEETFLLQWFDNITGEVVTGIKGKYGSYGAKIVPVQNGKRLDDFPKKQLALEYMKRRDSYTEGEKEKIQEELMQHVSEEAVTCKECHKRDGYIDFSSLEYKQARIRELTQLEVIKLIEEYKEFYIPTMFDPNVVGEPREDT